MSAATSTAAMATLGRTLKRLLPRSRPLALNLARAAQIMILSRELQLHSGLVAASNITASQKPVVNRSMAVARLQQRAEQARYGHNQQASTSIGLTICAFAGVGAAIAALAPAAGCESLQDCEEASETASPSYEGEDVSAGFEDTFEMRNLLGAGAFGVVMLCRNKATGDDFAVKIVQDLPNYVTEVAREQDALSRIEQHGGHANIVAYDRSYYEGGFHYVVMENLRGDSLFSFMKKRHALDVSSALQLVAQLADALVFMGSIDLIHRDLKPENIMVAVPGSLEQHQDVADAGPSDIVLKIIDFGSAGKVSRPESSKVSRPVVLSGTRTYWSPEVLEQQSMTAAMDAWALGCILYIMLSGRHPFDLMGCSTEEQILQRITSDQVSFLLPEWDGVPEDIKELVRGLLEKDPAQRLTPQDILAHPAVVAAVSDAGGGDN